MAETTKVRMAYVLLKKTGWFKREVVAVFTNKKVANSYLELCRLWGFTSEYKLESIVITARKPGPNEVVALP